MVPVFTFAHESHGEFNENTHMLYAKRSMTSAKKLRKNDALDDYDSILGSVLVSPWVSKRKKARGLIALTCAFDGGRYKIRTCDPIRVKDMLYP